MKALAYPILRDGGFSFPLDLSPFFPQAVSTLLRFDKEEEKLVTDHLNYKVSWFGSKPSLKKLKSAKVRDVL